MIDIPQDKESRERSIAARNELKEDAYRGWLADLQRQVNDGTISFTEFSDLVAQQLFARDRIIGKRKEQINAYREYVHTDKLVELPSEEAYEAKVDEIMRSGKNFGLLLIDLDGFKGINTQFGHGGGDLALIRTAQRLATAIRSKDDEDPERKKDEVYRLHGDELAVLVPNLTPDNNGKKILKSVAERIRESMAQEPLTITLEGKEIKVPATLSIGGGIFKSGTPKGFKDLVDRKALEQAKIDGKNRSFILNYDTPVNPLPVSSAK